MRGGVATGCWSLFCAVAIAGCDPTEEPADCRLATGETVCTNDLQCNDRAFCNGEEVCEPENPQSSACGCIRKLDTRPCQQDGQTCIEETRFCTTADCAILDADGDGEPDVACGGDDCADDDANRYPGGAEICDAEGHDEDCRDDTLGGVDDDFDGFVSAACCYLQPSAVLLCGGDCLDTDANVHPGGAEICNGVDDDCDGGIDDNLPLVPHFIDDDDDGFGTGPPTLDCRAYIDGFATIDGDCDDTTPSIFPGMIRCTAKPNEVEYCGGGTWSVDYCLATTVCQEQPGGWGVCL